MDINTEKEGSLPIDADSHTGTLIDGHVDPYANTNEDDHTNPDIDPLPNTLDSSLRKRPMAAWFNGKTVGSYEPRWDRLDRFEYPHADMVDYGVGGSACVFELVRTLGRLD